MPLKRIHCLITADRSSTNSCHGAEVMYAIFVPERERQRERERERELTKVMYAIYVPLQRILCWRNVCNVCGCAADSLLYTALTRHCQLRGKKGGQEHSNSAWVRLDEMELASLHHQTYYCASTKALEASRPWKPAKLMLASLDSWSYWALLAQVSRRLLAQLSYLWQANTRIAHNVVFLTGWLLRQYLYHVPNHA